MKFDDFPNLAAAIEAGKDSVGQGFTFLKRDGGEDFFSWARLHAEAKNRAAHLRGLGLRQGDRLAVILPDGEDFVPTFLGAVWAGVVPVPVYPPPLLGGLDAYLASLISILAKARPALLVTNAKLLAIIAKELPRIDTLQGVITAERLSEAAPPDADSSMAELAPDDTVFLQFTSGSTAAPKGVEVTHRSLGANARAIMRDGIKVNGERDHGVSWLPLYHDMGLIGFVLSPIFHKVAVTFIPTAWFVRSANIWLDTITRKKATISFAPNFAFALAVKRAKPEMLRRWDLSTMRVFGCGAEPINADTMRAFVSTFGAAGLDAGALMPCYGMAEATLAISFAAAGEGLTTDVIDRERYHVAGQALALQGARPSSQDSTEFVCCGKPFPAHDAAAFDDAGARLGDRRIGEIRVCGPSLAKGYFEDPEATARTFTNGWLRTGDLGYISNGNIYITGRQKDIIIINGRNYDPQRIEWLVDEVAEVRRGSAVAFSRPGAASEELVLAVESRTRRPDSLGNTLKQIVNEHFQLVVADVMIASPGALPKTTSGKLQRQKTRSQYLDALADSRLLPPGEDGASLVANVASPRLERMLPCDHAPAACGVQPVGVDDAAEK